MMDFSALMLFLPACLSHPSVLNFREFPKTRTGVPSGALSLLYLSGITVYFTT